MTAVAINIILAGVYLATTVSGAAAEMSAFGQWLLAFCTGIHAALAVVHVALWLRDRREAAE